MTVQWRTGRSFVSTDAPWEPIVGYSRAVRAGPFVAVTGTVGRRADGTWPEGAYAQAQEALRIVVEAIAALGGRPDHVVRTRIYVTDIGDWQEVGRAHAEVFGAIRPATTMVEVARLIDENALVEIEADAIVEADAPR